MDIYGIIVTAIICTAVVLIIALLVYASIHENATPLPHDPDPSEDE